MNEADACRIYVEPKLRAAGWETPPHSVASQPIIAPGEKSNVETLCTNTPKPVPSGQLGRV